jgi:hypothetical protein
MGRRFRETPNAQMLFGLMLDKLGGELEQG